MRAIAVISNYYKRQQEVSRESVDFGFEYIMSQGLSSLYISLYMTRDPCMMLERVSRHNKR